MAVEITASPKHRYCAIRETLDGSAESRFWLDTFSLELDPACAERSARLSDMNMPSYGQANPIRGIAEVKLEMVSVWKRF